VFGKRAAIVISVVLVLGILLVIGGILVSTVYANPSYSTPWIAPSFCYSSSDQQFILYLPNSTCPVVTSTKSIDESMYLQKGTLQQNVEYYLEIAISSGYFGYISYSVFTSFGAIITDAFGVSTGVGSTSVGQIGTGQTVQVITPGIGLGIYPNYCYSPCNFVVPNTLQISRYQSTSFMNSFSASDDYPLQVLVSSSTYLYSQSYSTSTPVFMFRFANNPSSPSTNASDSAGRFIGTFFMCFIGGFMILVSAVIGCMMLAQYCGDRQFTHNSTF
jgi:hypothetical protein